MIEQATAGSSPRKAGSMWTKHDDRCLLELHDAHFALHEIAEKLERTQGSVLTRLEKLGRGERVGIGYTGCGHV